MCHRDHDGLDGRHPGRQYQAVVIAVGHDDAADHPGANPPAGLVGVVGLVVLTGKGDVKGFGKTVSKIVAGAGLEGLVVMHHALHGVDLGGRRIIKKKKKKKFFFFFFKN